MKRALAWKPLRFLLAAATVAAAAAMVAAQSAPQKASWHIEGELTEACTCGVPCTCNFGERPSPHDYCWAMWSYWVKRGKYGDVDLGDMHIGGVEGSAGTSGLMDERATAEQRNAMEEIWYALSGRMLCLVRLWPFKATPSSLGGPGPATQGSMIHTRYADRKFLGFAYLNIDQQITGKGARIAFGDRGGFEARYLFGRDPDRPITVSNIVSWPVVQSIKGKTIYLKYKDPYNELDYKGTNSNQGHFDLSQAEAGARPMTAPR